jgi:uncharacterized lipoprotein YddW (UPF0748 family)
MVTAPTCWFRLILSLMALSPWTACPAQGENWIVNGDFESLPLGWVGAVLDREVVHAGQGALRLDTRADRGENIARYARPIDVNQDQPATIQAAFWMRFDAKCQTGGSRGGVTLRVEMADDTALSWYAPFGLSSAEMGSWVYREHRWKPKVPVKRIRPAVYLRGCEGSLRIDDLYLGPVASLSVPPRKTIPLAVTGSAGRFTHTGRLEFLDFSPHAHVFHLGPKNETNLELTSRVRIDQAAPGYLTSAWGSQYWTLYSPERRELAQIYTDERLDLSRQGEHTFAMRMSGFAPGASDLAATGYAFITDCRKPFLIYGSEKPQTTNQIGHRMWDTVEANPLSRFLGPSGLAAPFSLADLRSYHLAVSAQAEGNRVLIRPTLQDAQNRVVPLYGLDLRAQAGGKMLTFKVDLAADGSPTGQYVALSPGGAPSSIRVTGTVRLVTPTAAREASLDEQVTVRPTRSTTVPPGRPLDLVGWGNPSYELSAKASHGPESMRRLVADARAAGVTKLLIHARTSTETLYPSRIAPSTGTSEWDALAAAVAEGKRQEVAIHAAYILGIAQAVDLKAHPDWAMLDRGGKPTGWYCYTHPQVRDFHASLLAEIVTRYPVAGVSLDFCRPGAGCYCPRCAAAFVKKYTKPLAGIDNYDRDWMAWKRDQITEYLRELSQAVRKARSDAQLSGYVWGRFAPDADRAGQDWPCWLREGIMDFVAVGMYTPSTPWFRAQCHALCELARRELSGRTARIYPLLGVSDIQMAYPQYTIADSVIARHLQAAREEGLCGAGFFPFYSIRTHLAVSAAAAEGR